MERTDGLTIDLMMIVAKYFETANDFINVIKLNSRYKDICAMYFYNPISDIRLFPKVQTQHFYNKEDIKYRINGLYKYIFWNQVDQVVFLKKKDNEEYKNVILTKYSREIPPVEINNGLCIVPEGITKLGPYCLEFFNITKLILPTSLKSIENHALQSINIKDVTIPEGVTKLGELVFNRCYNLNSVQLPSTLKLIEDGCFNLVNVKTLKIPNSVISIGKGCFFNVDELFLPIHLKNQLKTGSEKDKTTFI